VFLANENEYISSKGNLLGPTIYYSKQTKLTKKTKTTDAPRKFVEFPTASGANVGDITPGIPKYPFIYY
jgi:hypothetical protein